MTNTAYASSAMFDTILGHVQRYQSTEKAEAISSLILKYSDSYSVDPLLVCALFTQESVFDMSAISPVGAIGIAQIMPATAKSLGINAYDMEQNIEGGIRYFSYQQKRFSSSGDWQLSYAIAAYNAGPGALEKYGGFPPYAETLNHVTVIYSIHTRLKEVYQGLLGNPAYGNSYDARGIKIEPNSTPGIAIYKKD